MLVFFSEEVKGGDDSGRARRFGTKQSLVHNFPNSHCIGHDFSNFRLGEPRGTARVRNAFFYVLGRFLDSS